MNRKKSSEKKKTNIFFWLLVSLLVSTLAGLSFNMLLKWYLTEHPVSVETISACVSFGMAIFILALLMLPVISKKALPDKGSEEFELSKFRAFTSALQKSASDYEIYQGFHKLISQIPKISHSTLYYLNDKYPDGDMWKRITNAKIPLCIMTHRRCPVIRSRKDCIVKSINNDIKCACQSAEYTSGSYICFPIYDSEHVHSILQVFSVNDNNFDNLAIQKIHSYIDIVKSAITSKKALTVLNKKASTDKLTKLYNRSFLDPYLENQIEASDLTGHPLSIIMVDIDYFKKINDTYGHAAGDHVLIVFSEILLRCTRQTDLVARFGGEEFIAVLPSTSLDTAVSIAERIRQTTSKTTLPPADGVYLPQITCSVGISTYPSCCSNKDELIKTADIALYKAKESGRNCVKVYGRI